MENILIYTCIAFTLAFIFYLKRKELNTYETITKSKRYYDSSYGGSIQ